MKLSSADKRPVPSGRRPSEYGTGIDAWLFQKVTRERPNGVSTTLETFRRNERGRLTLHFCYRHFVATALETGTPSQSDFGQGSFASHGALRQCSSVYSETNQKIGLVRKELF